MKTSRKRRKNNRIAAAWRSVARLTLQTQAVGSGGGAGALNRRRRLLGIGAMETR
jgi:hypothetical protein